MTKGRRETPQWRVAVTHDDIDGSVPAALEAAGFIAVSCPVKIEGPAADQPRLETVARSLDSYDWVICSSVRGVRALSKARGTPWPMQTRAAAVGAVTAQAMVAAGARQPIYADSFNASALWEKLQRLASWHCRKVLVVTVAGGRRQLIDGMTAAGASVTEIEAYTMIVRGADDIRRDWQEARPDAVILGSASTARHLIDAIGVDTIAQLRAVVPIGPTTAAALAELRIQADPPRQATFASAIDTLTALRDTVPSSEIGPVPTKLGIK
jgi:uroporphyrinogen III methyltransferase/synthase